MLFNSLTFAVFFVGVFSLYWLLRRFYRAQNLLLLGASYCFYGWWDIRFLVLIVISTVLDYCCALSIDKRRMSPAQRAKASAYLLTASVIFLGINSHAFNVRMAGFRPSVVVDWGHVFAAPMYWWIILGLGSAIVLFNAAYPFLARLSPSSYRRFFLALSVMVNLTMLGFFKYFNFFVDTFKSLVESVLGITPGGWVLDIILPVGISFFVFQTMSYTIDVYRGKMKATDSLIEVATYISFFPQLVAGPIERASHLLPQFQKPRTITGQDIRHGLWLIVWGLYQKMVIADNLSGIVDGTFSPYSAAGPATAVPQDGLRLLIAVYAFAIQIYCDFAGYTDVARGTARLLGFDIMLNFNLPYFARNPSDFWRRWHISLSSWLRDYLYIPLGGNRHGTLQTYRNLMLTMVLGGLWHGAAWTFVLWGAFHGFILVVYRAVVSMKDRWLYLFRPVFVETRMTPELQADISVHASDALSMRNNEVDTIVQQGGSREEFSQVHGIDDSQPSRPAEPVNDHESRCGLRGGAIAVIQIVVMFHLVCLGWLLFRSQDLATVRIFLESIFLHPHMSQAAVESLRGLLFYSWFLILFQLLQAWTGTLYPLSRWPWFIRLNVWVFVCMSLLSLAARSGQEFIYFAF